MLKVIQNMYHHYKYGKIVHRGADGTTIRKKVQSPSWLTGDKSHVRTTKTVINPFSQVEKQLNRSAYKSDETLYTTFDTVVYRPFDGQVHKKSKSINYLIDGNKKTIVDYNTTPDADYVITTLPDGRKQYDILYPEITQIIKDGPVSTTQEVKSLIID